jgi:hypothetical protein
MGNRLLLLPAMFVVLTMVSFTDKSPFEIIIGGIYGVCDSVDGKSIQFNLTLNDDHTFRYFKNDDPAHVIDVIGNWEMKGNSIVLKDYDPAISIHDKWSFDRNEACVKSRKGFEWTRLCHIKSCK